MVLFSAKLAICEENPPVTGGFPSQKAGDAGFDIFCVVNLIKMLSKESSCLWFETPWHSCDIIVMAWPISVWKCSLNSIVNSSVEKRFWYWTNGDLFCLCICMYINHRYMIKNCAIPLVIYWTSFTAIPYNMYIQKHLLNNTLGCCTFKPFIITTLSLTYEMFCIS